MVYVAFFFPATKDAVDASQELREEPVAIKLTRMPKALTGIQDGCNLGIISTDIYRDRIVKRLAEPQQKVEPYSYKIFEVPETAEGGLKPFVDMWNRCKW